jgi:hypothetical protein
VPKRPNPAPVKNDSIATSPNARRPIVPAMTLEALENRVFLTVTGFQSAVNYTSGSSPRAVATGDFTNNGRSDLVVVNQTSGTVSVFFSNLNGTLQSTATTLTDNAAPDAVAVGDFLGNGDEDIAVANHSNNTVSVWLGNGNGSFTGPATYSVGAGADAIASADLNGDGRDDLAVGTFTAGNVVVLLANSNGTTAANAFSISGTYSLGSGINGIAAGELSTDGYDDLAVSNVGGTVTILHNNGSGQFTTINSDVYNAGVSPAGVVIGNFQEAGDIAVADNGDGSGGSANVTVLRNSDGAGDNYQVDASGPYTAGANPNSIVAANINGDGRMDLAVTDDTDNTISLLYNNNTSSGPIFASPVTVATGTAPDAIATGDFTGGGLIDLAVANKSSGNASVFLHSSISVTGVAQTATEGTSLSAATVATFTDNEANASAGDFTAQVNWGDGTSTTGSVSSGNGEFYVTASHAYYNQGSYTMTVTVSDTNYDSAQTTASATVGDAALTATALTIAPTAGASYTGPVATFTDADPNGAAKFLNDPNQYTAIVAWGDGQHSAGVITDNNGTFDVGGTHTYTIYGTFSPHVTIEDEGGSTIATTSTANVADAAIAATGTTITSTEGGSFSGTIGTFTDANPYMGAGAFTATLHWGDGTTTTGTVINTGTGQFSITGSHTYKDAGSDTLSFTVSDLGGSSNSSTTSVQVNNATLGSSLATINATEGNSYTGTVATFTDSNTLASASRFTAVITWDDSTTSNGTVTGSGGNYVVTIPGGHTFNTPGSAAVSVLITGAGGTTTTASGNATVANAGITVTGGSISPTEGTPFTGTIATFTDANTSTTLAGSAYTASITWDDNTTTNATVTATGNGGYAITATHTFDHAGSKSYSISVTGPGLSAAATGTGTASVANATLAATASTVSASNGNQFSGAVATFTDSNTLASAADFSATIHWGDNSSNAGTITSQGGGNFTVSGTHTWANPGTPTITINLSGAGGWSASPSQNATVNDSLIGVTASTQTATEGTAWTGTIATFTDGNPSAIAGNFTSSINWGDGDSADTSATITESNGVFSVVATHTYEAPGTPNVTVTVTDNHSQSVNSSATVTVNYATIASTLSTITGTEGTASLGTIATFTDSNTSSTPSQFAATITGATSVPVTITSPSQVTWTQLGSPQTISAIGSSALGGLSIANANAGTLATATVGNFTLSTAPSAPTLLATSDINQVDLTWNPVAGASSYNVYRGTSPSGESGTPYLTSLTTTSYTDTSVTDGTTYYYTIKAINTVGTSASSSEASATPTQVPLSDADIGSPTYAGSASYTNGTYTVSGWGDISGTNDQLNFDSTATNGDTTLVTKVDSQTNTGGFAQAGIMFRDSSASNAMEFSVAGTPGGDYEYIYRTATGGNASGATGGSFSGSGWVKIVRSGNSFSAYYSNSNSNTSNITWTQIGSTQTISMSTSALAGLYVTSNGGTSVSTATFGNFAFSAPAAPTLLATGQDNQIALNWTPVPGATSYTILRGSTTSGETSYQTGITSTSYTDTGVTAGNTYYYTVEAVNGVGTSAQSAEVSATPTLAGLADADVNSPALAGSASYASGIYTINGSGDINGGSDSFNFDSAAVNGDTTLIAQLDTLSDPSGFAKSGLMIRNSAAGNATQFSIEATPGNGLQTSWRTSTGGSINVTSALSGAVVPVWLKIVRTGDVYTAYYSTQTTITEPTITQISPGHFAVVSNLLFNQAGSQNVGVTITDPAGQTTLATTSGTAAITSAGVTVTGGSISPTQGQSFSGTIGTFTDAYSGTTTPASAYTATITWDDNSSDTATITAGSNGSYTISDSHTFHDAGSQSYSISVSGPGMVSAATGTGTATVASASMQATIATVSATEGTLWTGTIATLSSSDSGALNPGTDYTATITWDDSTTSSGTVTALTDGTYSITASHTFDTPGTLGESISITGPGLNSAVTANGTATVANAGVTVTGGSIAPTEGVPFTGTIGTFTDSNTNTTGSASAYTAAIHWDNGNTDNATVTSTGNGTYSITDSHTFNDPGTQTYSISVTGAGLSTAATGTGSAAVVNAGISGTLSPITATEGHSWSGTVATFTDANSASVGSPDGYVATITWDDNTTSQGEVSPIGQSGAYSITSSHTFQTPGSAAVSISIAGTYNGLASPATISGNASVQTATLDVTAAGPLSFTEGAADNNVTVATFTTADSHRVLGDFAATVNWGDNSGTDSSTSIVSLGDETYAVVAAGHTYSDASSVPYSFTVNVTEGNSYQTQSDTGSANVAYATVSNPTISSITATEGTPWTGTIGTFTDSNTSATAAEFQATVTWADQSQTGAGVTELSPGNFAVTISGHAFPDAGNSAVGIAVYDDGSTQLSSNSGSVYIDNATVAVTGKTLSATSGNPFSGAIASFTDSNTLATAADFTATINWGDTTTSSGTAVTISQTSPGNFNVIAAHSFAPANPYTITITVHGAGGAIESDTSSMTVADAPIAVTGNSVLATEGTAYSGTIATFTDTDATLNASNFSSSIDWGDNSGADTSATITEVDPDTGLYAVVGTHTYGNAATFIPTVSVTHATTATSNSGAASVDVGYATIGSTLSTIAATEGTPWSGTVATFTDSNTSAPYTEFAATITWPGGVSTSTGTISSLGGGEFAVTASGHVFDRGGTRPVSVAITDSGDTTTLSTASGNASITSAGVTVTGGSINATQGADFNGTVATFSDSYTSTTTPANQYTATITWDNTSTTTGTVASLGNGEYSIAADHTFQTAGDVTYSISVAGPGMATAATDTGSASVTSGTITASVNPISFPEGSSYFGIVGSFSNADASTANAAGDYTATLTWDNNSTTTGMVEEGINGNYDVYATHTFNNPGTHTESISVTGPGMTSPATASTSATISNAGVTVTGGSFNATQGQSFTSTVGPFSDANINTTAPANAYAAAITWTGGSTSTGTITSLGGGSYSISATDTLQKGGSQSYSINVTGPGMTSVATTTGTVTVTSAGITSGAFGINATEGSAFSGSIVSFTNNDTSATDLGTDYSAAIHWGDGIITTGTVTATGNGGYTVSGGHQYDTAGSSIPMSVVMTGAGLASPVTISGTADVTSAGVTATLATMTSTEGQVFSGAVATFTDADPNTTTPASSYSAIITWPGNVTSSGTITAGTSGSYTVTGSYTFNHAGPQPVAISITGPGMGSPATASGNASISTAGLSATLGTITASEGGTFTGTLATFTDADANTTSIASDYAAAVAWNGGNPVAGTIVALGNGHFAVTGSETFTAAGTPSVGISITGPGGGLAYATGTAAVSSGTLSAAASPITATEGVSYSGTIATFSDAYTGTTTPANAFTAAITWGDSATSTGTVTSLGNGEFAITSSHTYTAPGSPTVGVSITGPGSGSATASTTATVSAAAITASTATISSTEGLTWSGTVATIHSADTASTVTAGQYTATITWPDNTQSSGTVTAQGGGVYTVAGTYVFNAAGSQTVQVAIAGPGGTSASATDTATIASAGITATLAPISSTEGTLFTGTVATFTDADPNTTTPASAYTATITWPSGTSAGTITTGTNGSYTVTGSNTFNSAGLQPVSISITGPGGAAATASGSAGISSAGLTGTLATISTSEGSTFSGTVATFTDADANTTSQPGDYTALISWAGGAPVHGTVTSLGSGAFAVSGSYTFTAAGNPSVTVSITGPASGLAYAAGTATVTSGTLSATASTISTSESTVFSGTVATFSDSYTATTSPASAFGATIEWGDNLTSAGTITSLGNGEFAVTASHTYLAPGPFTVDIDITGPGAGSATASTTATVSASALSAAPAAITATQGAAWTGTVATITNADLSTTVPASSLAATITWPDNSTSSGTITESSPGVYVVTGGFTFQAAGSQSVGVSVTGPGSTSASTSSTATVASAAVTATMASFSPTEGTPWTGTVATFANADTLTTTPASAYTATITWDDTTTSVGTITATSNGSYTVTSSHTFNTPGTLSESISITGPGMATAATATRAETIANTVAAVTGGSIAPTEGVPFSGAVATFSDPNSSTTLPGAAYTATITWDDSTTSLGTITSLGSGSYSISAAHTFHDAGSQTYAISLNGAGLSAPITATGTATVANGGISGSVSIIDATEGTPFTGVLATFHDADPLSTVPANSYMATITWDNNTTSTGTIAATGNGTFSISVPHTFQTAGSAAISISVSGPGLASTLSLSGSAKVATAGITATIAPISSAEGTLFTGTVATFTNANPNTTTLASAYTATITWPGNVTSAGTITTGTGGSYTVTGSNTFNAAGQQPVSISITGPGGAAATATGNAGISSAGLSATFGTITATEGGTFTGTVATFTDANAATTSPTSAYTALISWAGGTPVAGTITSLGNGVFAVTGSHTFTAAGSPTVAVDITGPANGLAYAAGTATITSATLTATPVAVTANEGTAFSGTVATFTDAYTATTSPASAFAATINWGDTTTSTGTVTSLGNGEFAITSTHTYTAPGSPTVTINVTGPGNGSATGHANATVAPAALSATASAITATQGVAWTGKVATITIADLNTSIHAGNLTATITWPDSSTSSGTITSMGGGKYNVTGSFTFANVGTQTVSVAITGPGSTSANVTDTATVAGSGILATITQITPTEGTGWTGQIAQFTTSNAAATASQFSATITWEDNTTTTGTILPDSAGGFDVEASHTFANAGYAPISVSITGPNSTAATVSGFEKVSSATVAVSSQSLATNPVEGVAYTGTVATFTDSNTLASPGEFTAKVSWPDGSTSAGTVAAGASPGSFVITSPHVFSHGGSYPLHVTVTTASGASVSATETAYIANNTLASTGDPVTAVAGAAFAGTVATFSDANLAAYNTDFIASVNFGDGSSAVLGTIASLGNGKFAVISSHTFTRYGSYPMTVSINGAGGGTSLASGTATVTNASLASSGVTLTEKKGVGFTTQMGILYSANPYLRLTDMSGTINWGDKSSSSAILQAGTGGSYQILGSHTYAALGKFNVSITLNEAGGGSTGVTSFVTVNTNVSAKPPKVSKTPKPKKVKTKAPKVVKTKTPKVKKSDKNTDLPLAA